MPLSFFKSRPFKRSVYFLLGIYILSLALFYLFRHKVIFQSTPLSDHFQYKFSEPFQEYFVKMNDGVELNALVFKSPTPSKGLIFYTHGNADNLQRWGNYAIDFTSLGYDVVMYDYRGYGKSAGQSNSTNLYDDSFVVYRWAVQEFNPQKIIIYGRSLGSTVASHLATKVSAELLILETPFAKFEDVVYWPLQPVLLLFPNDLDISNTKWLSNVSARKIIFQGTQDWVVPLSSAEKLKPLLEQPEDFIIIKGAGHKNIRDFELYHTRLQQILE